MINFRSDLELDIVGLSQIASRLEEKGGRYDESMSSLIRDGFWHLRPRYLRVRTQLLAGRNAYLHMLEGHSGWVSRVVFSHDGSRVSYLRPVRDSCRKNQGITNPASHRCAALRKRYDWQLRG